MYKGKARSIYCFINVSVSDLEGSKKGKMQIYKKEMLFRLRAFERKNVNKVK
jgi:hypothetical protein